MDQSAVATKKKHPTRFRDPKQNNDFFLNFTERFFIKRKVSPTEVERYGDYLWESDVLADKLTHAFQDMGMQKAMPMFNAAIEGRIAADSPQELRNFIKEVETLPSWLDKRLLDVGARLAQRSGMLGEYILSCVSLMGGYRSAAANKPIAFTGQLDYMAPRRLAETAKFGFDVTRTGAMAIGAQGYKSSLKVRLMHAHVRMMLDQSPKWRHDDWGLPINQADLIATNVLFSAVYLGGLRVMGLQISDEESLGTMHLWRYIGWLMGVDENLLPINEDDGTRMAWLAGVTQPGADEDSRMLGQALMNVPLQRAKNPLEKGMAWLDMQFRSGLSRFVLGDPAGDDLGLPNNLFKYSIALSTPIVFALETARRIVPGLTDIAVQAGDRLQRAGVEANLGGKPPAFVAGDLRREAAYG